MWEKFEFEKRIRKILKRTKYYQKDHHFKRPFLTAYQIAIAYANKYPEDFKKINKPIGGKDVGKRNTLAQYIAGELSRRMKAGKLPDIEGGFISNDNLSEISFQKGKIISSLTCTPYDLSIFRLKEKKVVFI